MNYAAILKYGLVGLSFLLAFLAFRLLWSEHRRPQIRAGAVAATYVFMIFALAMFALATWRQYQLEQQLPPVTWSFYPTGPTSIQCTANGEDIGPLSCAATYTCTDRGINYDHANKLICAGTYYPAAIERFRTKGDQEPTNSSRAK